MEFSKWAAYIKEREGVESVEIPEGFATFLIKDKECYIKDIFVYPEFRHVQHATLMANKISEIAKSAGCLYLTGSVCPSAHGSTESLKVLLGYGMRLLRSTDNLIIFIKDLG